MSIPTGHATPLTPTTLQAFNSATLTNFDPGYNPFDRTLYGTAASFSSSLSNFLIPSGQPNPLLTADTKYLVIKTNASSRLDEFTLNIGTSATGITNVYVKWERTADIKWGTNPAPWYNAKVGWQISGGASSSTPTPLGAETLFPIKINTERFSVPDRTQPGNIYFNIQFTGIISLNDIVIT
jgi:hypothetical protein